VSWLDYFLKPGEPFEAFGSAHLQAILLSAVIGFLFIYIGKKVSPKTADRMGYGLSFLLTGTVLLNAFILMYLGEWNSARDMPFAICNFTAYVAPILMFSKNKTIYNIFYFWVMFVTIQAMITPDLRYIFPHHVFIKFWIVHSGIVIAVLFLTFVKGFRPTYRGLWTSVFALSCYIGFMALWNIIFKTNHMYVCEKPPVASALDYFGPWPFYILVCVFLGIFGFHFVYTPFSF